MPTPHLTKPADVLRHLQSLQHHRKVQGGQLDPKLALLREWQSRRLESTYADLLAAPRYAAACRFFLTDIYAARDFSQRDHDLTEMYAFMQRFIPANLLKPLTLTVEVYALTQDLDAALLEVLVNRLGMTDTLSAEQYAEAYRICDNQDDRQYQIDLIYAVGKSLDEVVSLPLSGWALELARGPALRAGWVELTDFIERGYEAFKQMRGARYFLRTIRAREMHILNRIFARHPQPFDISAVLEAEAQARNDPRTGRG